MTETSRPLAVSFDNSYAHLPERFYARLEPAPTLREVATWDRSSGPWNDADAGDAEFVRCLHEAADQNHHLRIEDAD